MNDYMVPIRVARNSKRFAVNHATLKKYDEILHQEHKVAEAQRELKDLEK